MFKSGISCCYYPTTVVVIDDKQSFLDNVLLDLDENINVRSFTSPTKAIEFLQNRTLASFTDRYIKSLKHDEKFEELDSSNVEHGYVDVDLFNIHKEIYNPNRFNTAIVVVVDYAMPEMNGLEICRQLQGFPLKFVLITGEATLNDAVAAFNAGLIHQFIAKDSLNFTNKLETTIRNLQEKQFVEHSEVIIKNLAANRSTALSDLILVNFFKDFFKKNKITEYYLINESGCFLMADASGNLSCLAIKSETEMADYTRIAIDNYARDEVIKDLQTRKKILFLSTEEEHINTSVDVWDAYLYPATKIDGQNNTYYYAHVKSLEKHGIFTNKITSYEEFLAGQ